VLFRKGGIPLNTLSPSHPARILLINPRFPESFWSFRWALSRILPGQCALNPPLGLATLAALCPERWAVTIVDENIDGVPLSPEVDLVGICGMAIQFPRQSELLGYYRRRGYYVIAGGSYASLCPERFTQIADTVVAGEAEYIWPTFCDDWEHGVPASIYCETGSVDLAASPIPRFDLLKLDRYISVSLQFSRGCPYRCEFCDIIVMFGRRPRTKCPKQIGRELDALRAVGVNNVFFVDDNFIGHGPKAKGLLRYLADYQARHQYQFRLGTEVSLNLAEDDEMLELFRLANFAWVFVGIESPDKVSLKEAGKIQNTRQDIVTSVRKIYSYGIEVQGGFIVGFDNDTAEVFEQQRRFITATGIQVAMVGLLTALPRTPLYDRLQQEGRLCPEKNHADNTSVSTNIIPKRMEYSVLVHGYKNLYRHLVSDHSIAERILSKTRYLDRAIYRNQYSLMQRIGVVARLLLYGILPGGRRRCARFLATLIMARPRLWPLVISDWIVGLAMNDYVQRRFNADYSRDHHLMRGTLAFIEKHCRACLRRGTLVIMVTPVTQTARLTFTLRGPIDQLFFTRGGKQIENLLRCTAVTVTLRIESLGGNQAEHLAKLLSRLSQYGNQLSVQLDATLQQILIANSSATYLVLDDI